MPPRIALVLVLLAGSVLGAAEPARPGAARGAPPARHQVRQPGRVVAVHHPAAVSSFQVDAQAVPPMVEAGLARLTGQPTIAGALATLVAPQDVVAIHINVRGAPPLATHRALVNALVAGLRLAGVPASNIIVWGHTDREMSAAGYPLQTAASGVRHLAVVPTTGFDRDFPYLNENVGELIWGDLEFTGTRPDIDKLIERAAREEPSAPANAPTPPRQSSTKSYFARIVTRMATKIINVPVMSNSESTGLHGCLASLALDSVDNSRRFLYDSLWGDPAIAEICAEEPIRSKTVLHIMDGLLAQYAGGPSITANYLNEHATLYFGFDPVAIDATAARLMEQWRATRRLPALDPILGHIRTAASLKLGLADDMRVRIETIRLSEAPKSTSPPPVE